MLSPLCDGMQNHFGLIGMYYGCQALNVVVTTTVVGGALVAYCAAQHLRREVVDENQPGLPGQQRLNGRAAICCCGALGCSAAGVAVVGVIVTSILNAIIK